MGQMERTPQLLASRREQPRQRPLRVDDQIVFMHIPRTGGTALGAYVARQVAPEAVFQVNNMSAAELGPAVLARYAFVRGHFFLDLISRFITRPAVYITLLRDPVACVLAHYAHIQRTEPLPNSAIGHGMDLEEFIFHPLAVRRVTNLQTRLLAAPIRSAGLADVAQALAVEEERQMIGKCPSAAQAIEALHRMDYFGINECFAKSLALLAYTFDWPAADAVPVETVPPPRLAREDLAPHVLERIIELNQEDIQLYAYARQLFDERFAALLDTLLADDYRRAQLAPALPSA